VEPRKVVIVGGGITGLTTAYRLLRAGRDAADRPIAVTVLEERPRLGGNIVTERRDGFVIDGGPDSFVAVRPHATALCKEIGLGDRLIPTTERNRRVYVLHEGGLEELPEGLALGVPTRVLPMVKTKLVSWPAKARMALDLVLPRRLPEGDESIGHFVRRRLGDEATTHLVEPLLGGIYAGNVDTLSLRSTFPQLFEMEQQHRSLIVGSLAQRKARGVKKKGPPPTAFYSLLGGMGDLIDTLAAKITRAGGVIRTGARAAEVRAGQAARFVVRVAGEQGAFDELDADDVVLAAPAYASADALDGLDRDIAGKLRQIPYVSTAVIVLGYARVDVRHPLDASGFIVPKTEGRRILAATFISSKWTGRAPSDAALVRVFVGGHRDPGVLELSDAELIALAREELGELIGARARPMLSRVFRYERANAQPVIGHGLRMSKIRALAERHPGLHFAGAAFEGVGIPDCVRQAGEAAERIARAT